MKFKTTIFQKGNNLGIEVPRKIVALVETAKTEDTLNKRPAKIIVGLNQKIKL